ncbi:MAG: TatD family hydrolase [Bacteroidales bacterium]|nr:TatD family hydrolase [Bacteroidales bacterium]
MNFIDTHSHIYLEDFDADRDEIINNFKILGGFKIIVPDIDSLSREKMITVVNAHSNLLCAAVGIHPNSVNKDNYQKELNLFNDFITKNKQKIYAIGECGLDYYRNKLFKNEQIKVFYEQIITAKYLNLPLIIHSRSSLADVIKIIKENKHMQLKGVFHCFAGNPSEALFLIDKGFYIGIGGVITYNKNNLIDVVKKIPLEYILLETDSPFLSPIPHRGKRNEPKYIKIIAETIANIKNLSIEQVAEITTQNAKKLFNIN